MSAIGDGPTCPVEGHGRTFRLRGGKVAWCAHQSHDVSGLPSIVDDQSAEVLAATERAEREERRKAARARRYAARRARRESNG